MSLFRTLKAYMALNTLQRRLLKEKQLTGNYSLPDWLNLLGGLVSYDEHGDKLRRFSGIVFLAMIVPVFFSIVYPTLLLITIPIWLASGLLWLLTRKLDLSNHLRLFIMPLITLLGDDLKPGQTLNLRMDLRGGTKEGKKTDKRRPYNRGVYYKIVETLYQDPWLSGMPCCPTAAVYSFIWSMPSEN